MVTAIVSVMTDMLVRRDLAMIGEITLRGRVWLISGLKERLLAALHGGMSSPISMRINAALISSIPGMVCNSRQAHA